MGELEHAVDQLKQEGFSSEDIQKALHLMKSEARDGEVFSSLDEFLDALDEEED